MAADLDNIDPRLRELHELFAQAFPDMAVSSAYRDPFNNRRVGGAQGSQHMNGLALDYVWRETPPERQAEALNWWRANGAGGLGVYNNGSFHVDLGERRAWGPGRTHESIPAVPSYLRGILEDHRLGRPLQQDSPATAIASRLPAEPSYSSLADSGVSPLPGPKASTMKTDPTLPPGTKVADRSAPPAAMPAGGGAGGGLDDLLRMYAKPEALDGMGAPAPGSTAGALGAPSAPVDLLALYGKPDAAAAPARSTGQAVADTVGSFAAGAMDLPIAGPAIKRGLVETAARARQLFRGEDIDAARTAASNKLMQVTSDHPWANTAGNLYGNVAAMAPIAMTAPGAAAFGMGPGGFISRSGASAFTGAGIGSIDAAVRGQDAGSAAIASGIGGGIAPGAGQALGWAGNKFMGAVSGMLPEGASLNALANVLRSSGKTPAQIQQEMNLNPRLAAMDLDPALQQQAMGLATQPGRARSTLATAAENRAATAPGAIANVFDEAMGPIGSPVALRQGLTETAKANAQKGFGEALANAEPIALDGLTPSAIKKISDTWNKVLERFPDKTQAAFSQPEQMHLVQQELRREAEALASSAVGTERLAAGQVNSVRSALVDRIDKATGGKFKAAQRQFADDMSVGEAFDTGMSWRRSRQGAAGLDDHPDALKRWWNGASDAEQEAYRQGMRADIEQAVGSVRNAARKGAAVPEVDFNRAKMETVLGKDETDRLVRLLGDEQKIAGTNAKLFAGSQTAPRQAAERSVSVADLTGPAIGFGLPAFAYYGGQPLVAAGTAAATAAGLGLQAGRRALNVGRNNRLADMLSASGPEGQAMLNKLMAYAAPDGNVPAFAQGIEPGTNLLLRAGAGQFR